MITLEIYQQDRPRVVIERGADTNPGAWARLQEALARGVLSGSDKRSVVHPDVLFSELNTLREVRSTFAEKIQFGPNLQAQLKSIAADRKSLSDFLEDSEKGDSEMVDLTAELSAAGFKRTLKEFQMENLSQILTLPHAADFSVPGAGKTTVALAAYSLLRARGEVEQLLVIAPLAAFGAWQDDSVECFSVAPKIVTYGGANTAIPSDTEILLVNYNRVASDYDRIREFVSRKSTRVVVDEAHRIKRGGSGVYGRAVLDLAYLARRRDVLTGTPAPQGASDVVALVQFMYPGQDRRILPDSTYNEREGRDPSVLAETQSALARFFVRTAKSRLELPPTSFNVVQRPMGQIQSAVYDALVGRYRSAFMLDRSGRHNMQRLGRIVMYLLEAATNPMLLTAGSDEADDPSFVHPPLDVSGDEPLQELLQEYSSFETPWKYEEVQKIVSREAASGQKVLIWSSFVRNLKYLKILLSEFNPAMVHGGVPSAAGAGLGVLTREEEFNRFRHDSDCCVLLANPAACGEGVSLHHWCHHAVYLDRSFNAGHFLQSQDRIHRLGLNEGTQTSFTLLISEGTIDESVDARLREKVEALATLMNDPGLVSVALPAADVGEDGQPAFEDDLSAIVSHLETQND